MVAISMWKRHGDVIIVANDNKPIVRHKKLIRYVAAKTWFLYVLWY